MIRHNLEDYCLPRWGNTAIWEIKPKALEEWLRHLHEKKGLGWTTISSKVKQAMQGVFKCGRKEGLLPPTLIRSRILTVKPPAITRRSHAP